MARVTGGVHENRKRIIKWYTCRSKPTLRATSALNSVRARLLGKTKLSARCPRGRSTKARAPSCVKRKRRAVGTARWNRTSGTVQASVLATARSALEPGRRLRPHGTAVVRPMPAWDARSPSRRPVGTKTRNFGSHPRSTVRMRRRSRQTHHPVHSRNQVPVNRVVAFPVLATARSALEPVWDFLWMPIADTNFDDNETMRLGPRGSVVGRFKGMFQ